MLRMMQACHVPSANISVRSDIQWRRLRAYRYRYCSAAISGPLRAFLRHHAAVVCRPFLAFLAPSLGTHVLRRS